MNIFIAIFCAFIMTSAIMYCWYKLSNKKVDFKDYKLYITIIIISIISAVNFIESNKYIRIIIITFILILFYKFLFKDKWSKTIVIPLYSQFLTILSESVYTIILIIVLKGDIEKILDTSFGTILTNVAVSIILLILVNLKFFKGLCNRLLKTAEKINNVQLILFCLILIIVANILLMTSYYKIEFKYYFIFNTIMILICVVIIIHSVKTQSNYNTVSDNYNVAKNSLKDYETMMTKYRIANHENKNLLLTIRAMILNNEENIPEYINKIIKKRYMDDEKLLFEMSVIPTGGLRATIYSEILKIKDSKIKYNLSIDRKISTIDLIELDTNTTIDICKIIGVFIDNSIEAVRELKHRIINIEIYIHENNLCIKVSNNYKEKIDIDKISIEGYTTKGKGHGYGLCLVKNIIDNNNLLQNRVEVSKKIFSQILMIQYKKNH